MKPVWGALCACSLLSACTPADFVGVDPVSGREIHARAEPNARVNFSGTYTSPEGGTVFLWQDADRVQGSFTLHDCERAAHGWLTGKVRGNRAEVVWSELQYETGVWKKYDSDGYLYLVSDSTLGPAPRLLGEQTYVVVQPEGEGFDTVRIPQHTITWTALRTGPVSLFPRAPAAPVCKEGVPQ